MRMHGPRAATVVQTQNSYAPVSSPVLDWNWMMTLPVMGGGGSAFLPAFATGLGWASVPLAFLFGGSSILAVQHKLTFSRHPTNSSKATTSKRKWHSSLARERLDLANKALTNDGPGSCKTLDGEARPAFGS